MDLQDKLLGQFTASLNNIFLTHRKMMASPKFRSSRPEVLIRNHVLKICSKFTGVHPCRSVISIKLLCNFIEIALRHGWAPVNLLDIFRTPFPKNTSGQLLLKFLYQFYEIRSWKSVPFSYMSCEIKSVVAAV